MGIYMVSNKNSHSSCGDMRMYLSFEYSTLQSSQACILLEHMQWMLLYILR